MRAVLLYGFSSMRSWEIHRCEANPRRRWFPEWLRVCLSSYSAIAKSRACSATSVSVKFACCWEHRLWQFYWRHKCKTSENSWCAYRWRCSRIFTLIKRIAKKNTLRPVSKMISFYNIWEFIRHLLLSSYKMIVLDKSIKKLMVFFLLLSICIPTFSSDRKSVV